MHGPPVGDPNRSPRAKVRSHHPGLSVQHGAARARNVNQPMKVSPPLERRKLSIGGIRVLSRTETYCWTGPQKERARRGRRASKSFSSLSTFRIANSPGSMGHAGEVFFSCVYKGLRVFCRGSPLDKNSSVKRKSIIPRAGGLVSQLAIQSHLRERPQFAPLD